MRFIVLTCTLPLVLAVSCGGNSQDAKSADKERAVLRAVAAKTPTEIEAPRALEDKGEDPDLEMIAGLALPTPIPPTDGGAEAMPTDRQGLYKMALTARDKGLIDEALSYVDVLLVMNADDAEILELRGAIQLGQGLVEDAAVDFERCCKLGRVTCCGPQNHP